MKSFAYDAGYYETGIGGFHRASFPIISSVFDKYFRSQGFDCILDFGCGAGFWGQFLSNHCRRLMGVDFSDILPSTISRPLYYEFSQIDLGRSWESIVKYDLVFSIEVIEHVEDCEVFLANAFNALKPGGFLFLTTTTYFWTLFVLLIVYRRQTTLTALWEFLAGLLGNERKRRAFVSRFWEYFAGHYHGFTRSQLRRLALNVGFRDIQIENLHIQPVVPVNYLDQPYTGSHPGTVAAVVPLIRIIGNAINWLCRSLDIYAPNVLLIARRPIE
ncbi:MAG: hypothetical protein QOH39_2002 [Verrucomicrobiota bacterium]|jgi:SAM-dependent methyltransferase